MGHRWCRQTEIEMQRRALGCVWGGGGGGVRHGQKPMAQWSGKWEVVEF